MICLLALLLLSIQLYAQPWEIATSENAITSPEVCVRGSEADILFIENDSVRYARFSLTTHQVTQPPTPVFAMQGWNTEGLHDLIQVNDTTWACLVSEDDWGAPQNVYHRTDLLYGDETYTNTLNLDSSVTHQHFPQFGEYWNYGYSLATRVGGGIATGWIGATFFQFDLSMCFHFRSFHGDFTQDYWAQDCIGIGYILERNRVLARSITTDSFLVVSATIPLCTAITTSENNYYSSAYWQTDCEFTSALDFGLTRSGNILVLTCNQDWDCVPLVQSIEITGEVSSTCITLSTVDLPSGTHATFWHPSYGFAILHTSSNSLQLARVDTNGTQFLPTGTLAWRDSLHTFSEANVTITDSGKIVAVWTESAVEDTAARRLMLTTVDWDTPLSTDPSEFIPHPSSLFLSAFPNPFNNEVTINYDLPKRADIELAIYNLLGERVALLKSGIQEAGSHTAHWQPNVSSGIYFARLSAPPLAPPLKPGETVMQKIVYLR